MFFRGRRIRSLKRSASGAAVTSLWTGTALSYDDETRQFINPSYDDRASALRCEMEDSGAGMEILKEVDRCLRLGCVRSDWRAEPSVIEEQIRNARYISEKNYWVCMKKLYFIHSHVRIT